MPLDQLTADDPEPVYSEETLAQALGKGEGFVLHGPPTAGKSRTLYDVVRRMNGYDVVKPNTRGPIPSNAAFSLLKGRRVVLLLDDLNDYAGGGVDLLAFCQTLGQYADQWAVAAACRDGVELAVVKRATETGLRRFYEEIPLRLALLPQTPEEKRQLATGIGKEWDFAMSEWFPTPGAITMATSMRAMRDRFEDLSPEERDILWALKLLTRAAVLPLTSGRLRAVLARIFERPLSPAQLRDGLNDLEGQAFLRRTGQRDAVQPELAYLQDAVIGYRADSDPVHEFPALADTLTELKDSEGLFYLGTAYAVHLTDQLQALVCYERALGIDPALAAIWYNKGVSLQLLDRDQEALAAFDEALRLEPDFTTALVNKAAALNALGRYDKALYDEALAACARALQLDPDNPLALLHQVEALSNLGRFGDVLDVCEHALTLDRGDAPAVWPAMWGYKAEALQHLGHDQEALVHQSVALYERMRYADAFTAAERVLKREPNRADAMVIKGMSLRKLGRSAEAITVLKDVLKGEPNNRNALLNIGFAKAHLATDREGKREAATWLCRGLQASGWVQHPENVAIVAQELEKLGYRPEDCSGLAPPHPEVGTDI